MIKKEGTNDPPGHAEHDDGAPCGHGRISLLRAEAGQQRRSRRSPGERIGTSCRPLVQTTIRSTACSCRAAALRQTSYLRKRACLRPSRSSRGFLPPIGEGKAVELKYTDAAARLVPCSCTLPPMTTATSSRSPARLVNGSRKDVRILPHDEFAARAGGDGPEVYDLLLAARERMPALYAPRGRRRLRQRFQERFAARRFPLRFGGGQIRRLRGRSHLFGQPQGGARGGPFPLPPARRHERFRLRLDLAAGRKFLLARSGRLLRAGRGRALRQDAGVCRQPHRRRQMEKEGAPRHGRTGGGGLVRGAGGVVRRGGKGGGGGIAPPLWVRL